MPVNKKTVFFSNLIRKLIYLLIFLLPFQTRWIYKFEKLNGAYFEYGTLSLYATEVLAGVIVLLGIIFVVRKIKASKARSASTASKVWFGVSLLCLVVPTVFAQDVSLASQKLTFLILAAATGLVALVVKADKIKIGYALVFAGIVQSMFAIQQFVTQKVWASTLLGISAQNPQILGASVIETSAGRILRSYGSFPHPNMLGGFLAICLLIAIGICLQKENREKKGDELVLQKVREEKKIDENVLQNGSKEKKIDEISLQKVESTVTENIWLIGFYILGLVSLLMSGSRGGMLGLLIGLLLYYVHCLKGKTQQSEKGVESMYKVLNKILIITILVFVLFSVFQGEFVNSRIEANSRLEKISTNERDEGYSVAWKLLKQNWLVGVGPGNYSLAYASLSPGQPAWYYQPVHNVFVLAIVEFGVLFIVMIALFLYCFIIFFNLNKQKLLNQTFFLPLLIALFVLSIFDHYLYSFWSGIMLVVVVRILTRIEKCGK